MSLENISFNATVGAIFLPDGKPAPAHIGRGVYREDTGELLSVCGPNFHPVQHHQIIEPLLDDLAGQGYEVLERNPTRNDLEDLRGERGAFLKVMEADNGAVMRADIILGDFIQPTGSTSYLDDGPDTNFFRISVLNSHNGKFAVHVNTSYLRLICMNGMTQPHFSANTYGKHTGNFSAAGMQAQIKAAVEAMSLDADRFGIWARTKLTPQQAEEMLIKTIARLPNKPNGEANYSSLLVKMILTQFQKEDQTVWGLFNAVTWWQTHSETRQNSNVLTSTVAREKRVAAMLRTPIWREVHAA